MFFLRGGRDAGAGLTLKAREFKRDLELWRAADYDEMPWNSPIGLLK